MDMQRDVYAPVGFLLAGFLLFVGFYAYRYSLGAGGMATVSFGLGILTAFKAALLIGFALVAAGPLGVSFGGLWTAALKLAAIAVFSDGINAWVEHGVDKMSGAGGGFGFMLSYPVTLAVFWGLLTYLFSMDAGDSWMVVVVLSVFNRIVQWVLFLLLLTFVLKLGGAAPSIPTLGGGSGGGGSSNVSEATAEMRENIADWKDRHMLEEAKKYIQGGRQAALTDHVNNWYAAGAKNIWFVIPRDINGNGTAQQLVVELPPDKTSRAKCYEILKTYYKNMNITPDPSDVKDTGEGYIEISVN